MVDKERYESIRGRIMEIVNEAEPSIDPSDLLRQLREEDGISRELASTVMLEMVGAGYISRNAEDWRLSRKQEAPVGLAASAH